MLKYNVDAWRNDGLPGMFFTHLGAPFCRSSMEKTWEKYEKECMQTCRYRLRDIHQITHQIYSVEDILQGNFVPVGNDWGTVVNIEDLEALRRAYESRRHKMICFSDRDNMTAEEVDAVNRQLIALFDGIFPKVSAFEQTGGERGI